MPVGHSPPTPNSLLHTTTNIKNTPAQKLNDHSTLSAHAQEIPWSIQCSSPTNSPSNNFLPLPLSLTTLPLTNVTSSFSTATTQLPTTTTVTTITPLLPIMSTCNSYIAHNPLNKTQAFKTNEQESIIENNPINKSVNKTITHTQQSAMVASNGAIPKKIQ